MEEEVPFPRRVNEDPAKALSGRAPEAVTLTGRIVKMEPLDLARHGPALYHLGHESEAALRSWAYLPWGPFADEASMREQLQKIVAMPGNMLYAICEAGSGDVLGMAGYWDSQPAFGVVEPAVVWFSEALKRTKGATEALFLLIAYGFDDLGCRRVQWRCNALNINSRAAARRLGFRFEGIFFANMVARGRNRDTAWYSILESEWPRVKAAIEAWLDPANFDAAGIQKRSLSAMTASPGPGLRRRAPR
jgi:RimJ/RimL family protein N-acetyltransferase